MRDCHVRLCVRGAGVQAYRHLGLFEPVPLPSCTKVAREGIMRGGRKTVMPYFYSFV